MTAVARMRMPMVGCLMFLRFCIDLARGYRVLLYTTSRFAATSNINQAVATSFSEQPREVQSGAAGLGTGNGEKLSCTQATPARQADWLLISFSRPHSVQYLRRNATFPLIVLPFWDFDWSMDGGIICQYYATLLPWIKSLLRTTEYWLCSGSFDGSIATAVK